MTGKEIQFEISTNVMGVRRMIDVLGTGNARLGDMSYLW